MPCPTLTALCVSTIWIVDAAGGPGSQFTDIPAAIGAAQSGDTILVRNGSYSAFVLAGKALTIRGAGSATTWIDLPAGGWTYTTITSAPVGQRTYLSGFTFRASAAGSSQAALNIVGAHVVLSDCVATGVGISPYGSAGVLIQASQVHATRCRFVGGTSQGSSGWSPSWTGLPGAQIRTGSAFAADACVFIGGSAYGGYFLEGGAGLSVTASRATLHRCSSFGGNVGNAFFGASGCRCVTATTAAFVRIAGDAGHTYAAGSGTNGPVFAADATSSMIVHGPVTIVPSSLIAPATAGAVAFLPDRLPQLQVTGMTAAFGTIAAGSPVTVTIDGVYPNALYVLAVADAPAHIPASAPLAGEVLLDPASMVASLGLLGPTGVRTFSFVPAGLPLLVDRHLHAQVAVLDGATAQLRLGQQLALFFEP